MDVIRHQMPLFDATLLLLRQRAEDLPKMPSQLMVERFPTILRDKDHMMLAVPLGMTESFAVWHDKLPLGGTLSGAPKGVCRLDSRNCQTLGVPRQSRGFTMIKLRGYYRKAYTPVITVPRLAPQTFVHPDDGHWLKLPEGFERMLFQAPLSVTQVVYLVLKRTMQLTGSLPRREPYYVKLSYAYVMRGGRMSSKSVERGLQEAVAGGHLLRRRVGKQQWEYAVQWKG